MATTVPVRTAGGIRRWWPAAAGLVTAGIAAIDIAEGGGVGLAPVLAASAVIYLGAAALGRPAASWPIFLGAVVLLALADDAAIWVLLGAGALLGGYGLLRGASGLPLQVLGMAGFGLAAVVALAVSPDLGSYLVAAGLLGHAAWDVYHHRTGRVVVRSLAEFCVVLDTLLAAAIIVATLVG